MSPVVDATTEDGHEAAIQQAADAVRAGEVVVLPTDTVYGIGCDAFNAVAVTAVLDAKGRGRDMPPPVLVPSPRTVDGLATEVPGYARDLIRTFWPGPLTLVLIAQPTLQWDLGDTNGTVALRMPDDEVCLEVLSEVGPMAVTSANRTGHPPAHNVTEAAAQLGAAVSVYLDAGERGVQQPSTIVDCTGPEPTILREGAITHDQIAEVIVPHLEYGGEDEHSPRHGVEGVDPEAHTELLTPEQLAELDAEAAADELASEAPAVEAGYDDPTPLPPTDEPETTEIPVLRRRAGGHDPGSDARHV